MLMAALALGACGALIPSATQAASADVMRGGCNFETDQVAAVTGDQYVGTMHDLSVTTTGDTPPVAIGATVTCWIDVNGIESPGTRSNYSGIGVQAGVNSISFTALPDDEVTICHQVAYADGSSEPAVCPPVPVIEIPPETCCDIAYVLDYAFFDVIDPTICPELADHAGAYGPLTIAPDGDIYVPDPLDLGLNPFYDCPPYGNF
jgi:hypothetical protein